MTAPSTKLVPALANAIRILRHINDSGEPSGVMQIAQALKINPSTCFNLLKTLAHERLLVFDADSKKYRLGLGVVELAHGALSAGYVPYVHPHLQTIAREFDVTALLWQDAGQNRFVLIDKAESHTAIRVQIAIGQRFPALIGAFGRCVAAHRDLDKATAKAIFKQLRWQNPPSFEDYWSDVEFAKANGYAIDIGHYNVGITTVAAVITGQAEATEMAISAIALSDQLPESKLFALAQQVKASAQEISVALKGGRSAG